jgi:hypothetical protein
MAIVIKTRYVPESYFKPSRVIATASNGKRLIVSYDGSDNRGNERAALTLLQRYFPKHELTGISLAFDSAEYFQTKERNL